MIVTRDRDVTARSRAGIELAAPATASEPAGVWTLAGDRLIIADAGGPATVLVPCEAVLLLGVDLPLASRTKRQEALPFAIEDRIAESVESVHLAIGAELAPKRYLVGVVRHDRMAEWIDRIEQAGLSGAALVPDALALPQPPAGEWSVDLAGERAVVRTGDGTGFAVPAAALRTAWEAAGRPPATGYGEALPQDMAADAATLQVQPLAQRLLLPALDLRQGVYARRRRPLPAIGRRLAMLAVAGVLAHTAIAAADALALRSIADRREAETRALILTASPGADPTADPAELAADLLPAAGGASGTGAMLPLLARVSSALTPIGPAVTVRTISFDGAALTLDMDAADPSLQTRISQALTAAGVSGGAAPAPEGGLRVTARAGA